MGMRRKKEPLTVSTVGTSEPIIIVEDAELETVRKLLDMNGWGYVVDLGAIRASDAQDQHVIKLGRNSDVVAIQTALDSLR